LLLFIKLNNLLIYWKNAYFFSCQPKSYKVQICFLSWAAIIILCSLILKWLTLKLLNIWMRKFIIFLNTCLKRGVISRRNLWIKKICKNLICRIIPNCLVLIKVKCTCTSQILVGTMPSIMLLKEILYSVSKLLLKLYWF